MDSRKKEELNKGLADAVKNKQADKVEDFLKKGADPSWRASEEDPSNLHITIQNDDFENFKLLLRYKADITVLYDNQTPARLADTTENHDFAKEIASHIVIKDYTNEDDLARLDNSFLSAVSEKNIDLAKLFLDAGAEDGSTFVASRNNSLHTAVFNNDPRMLKFLLENETCDALKIGVNKANQTPLDMAFSLEYWECAERILRYGKLSNTEIKKYELCKLVKAKKTKLCEYLLEAGVSPNKYLTKDKNRCLHLAVLGNDLPTLELLLKHLANQSLTNSANFTPLELASQLKHWGIVKFFLAHNGFCGQEKMQAMHYPESLIFAIEDENYPIVKLFLDFKSPCDKFDAEKGYNIAIYTSLKKDNVKILELLLQNLRSDQIKEEQCSKSLIQLATELKAVNCLNLLLERKQTATIQSVKLESKIDQYRSLLIELAEDIADHQWEETNFLGKWRHPGHIKRIIDTLEKTIHSDNDSVRNALLKIHTEFTQLNLDGRPKSTRDFAVRQRAKINAIMNPSSSSTALIHGAMHNTNSNLVPLQPVYFYNPNEVVSTVQATYSLPEVVQSTNYIHQPQPTGMQSIQPSTVNNMPLYPLIYPSSALSAPVQYPAPLPLMQIPIVNHQVWPPQQTILPIHPSVMASNVELMQPIQTLIPVPVNQQQEPPGTRVYVTQIPPMPPAARPSQIGNWGQQHKPAAILQTELPDERVVKKERVAVLG